MGGLKAKRILVTGAGGSIGSELCRQLAALHPHCLVLYGRYENGLYAVMNDLGDRADTPLVRSVIGDLTDVHRVDVVLEKYR